MYTYRLIHIICNYGQIDNMIPMIFEDILSLICLPPFLSFCIYVPSLLLHEAPFFPLSSFPHQITYNLTPSSPFFYFSGSCECSRLYTHLWRFRVRIHTWERTCDVWLGLCYLTLHKLSSFHSFSGKFYNVSLFFFFFSTPQVTFSLSIC